MPAFIPRVASEGDERGARKRRLYEGRRERAFYSYYESVLSLFEDEPQLCDLNDPSSVAAHRAVSSPDKALTAFVQLVALKLRTRRSMLFFFDSDYAYILAESTQSLSLQDDSRHEAGDALWLGASRIPRGFSVCEHTADLPNNEGSNAKDLDSSSIAHIINNLTEDTRFCDRPYVKDGPRARFYAGVPITTPEGLNIGALCALDDKPRDGIDPADVHFLREMAATVMSHLELVRAKNQNQRSRDMTHGLGAFVEGKSQSREWWHRSSRRSSLKPERKLSARKTQTAEVSPVPQVQLSADARHETSPKEENSPDARLDRQHSGGSSLTPPQSGSPTDSLTKDGDMKDGKHTQLKDLRRPSRSSEALQEEGFTAQVKETTYRAATLIREAVDADGVIFLDASISSFGGLVNSVNGLSQSETDTDGTGTPDSKSGTKTGDTKRVSPSSRLSTENSRNSPILGSSYSRSNYMRQEEAIPPTLVAEKSLRSLLRRYPRGKVWHFDKEGNASDEEDASEFSEASAHESAGSDTGTTNTPSSRRAQKRIRGRKKDGQMIQQIFPGVRSVVFQGMREFHRERYFGAAVLISYSPTRIFSVSNELAYLAAFCDVMLAEIWRLEALNVGRMKNDFISSISHELRSPLHGILGSAEHLEDQENSPLSQELIRSITSCGSTLLDIINDLLEFSRLNTETRNKKSIAPSPDLQQASNAITGIEAGLQTVSKEESGTLLNVACEAAINASCLGFSHQGTALPSSSPITVILNIDEPTSSDWCLAIEVGAWKRIMMNLVSNALKYTPSGHISVSLSKKWTERRRENGEGVDQALVSLRVEDTGIGMSEAFQVQNLFKPFQQENSLVRGTGLGLNLVAQIVRSLGGTLQVRSTKGVGTSIELLMPLRSAPLSPSAALASDLPSKLTSAASVVLVGFNAGNARSSNTGQALDLLSASLRACCANIGLQVIDQQLDSAESNTIYVVHEQDVQKMRERDGQTAGRGIGARTLIVCGTRSAAFKLQSTLARDEALSDAQYLWLPIGPSKLVTAVSTCLSSASSRETRTTDRESSSHPNSALPYGKKVLDVPPKASELPSIAGAQDVALAGDLDKLTMDSRSKSPIKPSHKPKRSVNPYTDTHMSSSEVAGHTRETTSTEDVTASARAPSLLLVEDNTVNLRLLSIFAKKSGHEYQTAENGREAFEIYREGSAASGKTPDSALRPVKRPDVILMDINMPVMNGFQAARKIRQFEQENNVPQATIIAVTGLGDLQAQDEAFASGMNLFLTKPVKLKELGAILAKIRDGET